MRLVRIVVGLGLALLLSRSAQAYMTDDARLVNTFTMRKGGDPAQAAAVLTEPLWDPAKGLSLVPGREAPKDPQITNVSGDEVNELVAIRMRFMTSDGTRELTGEEMQSLIRCLRIDYEADGAGNLWVRYEGDTGADSTQAFYYTKMLKRNFSLGEAWGESTKPLFTKVWIPQTVGNKTYLGFQNLGGFQIHLVGAAIPYLGDEEGAAEAAALAAQAGDFSFAQP